MEDLYRNIVVGSSTVEGFHHHHHQFEGSSAYDNNNNYDDNDNKNELTEELEGAKVEAAAAAAAESENMSDLIKSQIATHLLYPELVSAYISCRKVGAPPEIATLLEEIGRVENQRLIMSNCAELGADPQLDEFMESYCEVLHRYKEELSKPFDEATIFLKDIESQLNNLCRDNPTSTLLGSSNSHSHFHSADEAAGASEDEQSCGEAEAPEAQSLGASSRSDREMKEILRNKYSGCLSSLRREFLKKRKNGKLPKDARAALLEWWNTHYRWPYPTEEEKLKLSESTGLDQKQINNWFINQRKRHWKPSEDMRFALMEGVGGSMPLYYDTGDGGGHQCT
ncbi:hypothetical protein CDL15_Pgr018314 [Punica granatum]|uniref:Homeobox protein knotted-1-like 1 n=2 Tax=Punica granatum TaxID=22663 RepID=A0A218WIX9_PUNGR|nr:hypothetical protein CDL15_Pgr018314 [Punica granatum]